MDGNPPGETEHSQDSPPATRSRKRRGVPIFIVASVAVLALVAALGVRALTTAERDGDRAAACAEHEGDGAEHANEGENGEACGEDDGGPAVPAEYLTQKFTSGKDVTQAQVDRARDQAAALQIGGGNWSLVGPTNIGGRVTDIAVDP